jgi:hypothetical protein
VKEGKGHDKRIFGFLDAVAIDLPDSDDTAQKLQVALRNAFGKAGCPSGIQQVSDMTFGIYIDVRRSRRVFFHQPFEEKDVIFSAHGTLYQLIKELAEDSFSDRE